MPVGLSPLNVNSPKRVILKKPLQQGSFPQSLAIRCGILQNQRQPTCALTMRGSELLGFEKPVANGGNVLPKLPGLRQRAVDAASQVADAVSVPKTKYGRQLTQRTGR
jgi:hypothetical protein